MTREGLAAAGYRFCACGRATKSENCRCGRKLTEQGREGAIPPPPATCTATSPQKGRGGGKALRKKPTQTELDYRTEKIDTIDDAEGIMYEGVTFRLASGHRYTPDWVYWLPLHRLHAEMYCVEVKGQYRLPSYQRARLAFDQAAIEYPAVTFLWAERQPDKSWKVTKGGVE